MHFNSNWLRDQDRPFTLQTALNTEITPIRNISFETFYALIPSALGFFSNLFVDRALIYTDEFQHILAHS